ncbi:hypothetical protein BRC69_01340 [Halobacteriales archaeon QH_6_66_25]|nr:MAG: hypothetical protein BRC69_01340 [Halobacteriales archaeon QH_6_66_25]
MAGSDEPTGSRSRSRSCCTRSASSTSIVAGVVWVEYAARDTISRLVVIYLAFLCIPLGDPYHVKSPARRTTA